MRCQLAPLFVLAVADAGEAAKDACAPCALLRISDVSGLRAFFFAASAFSTFFTALLSANLSASPAFLAALISAALSAAAAFLAALAASFSAAISTVLSAAAPPAAASCSIHPNISLGDV